MTKRKYRADGGPLHGSLLSLSTPGTTARLRAPGRYRGRYVPLSPEPDGSVVRWEPYTLYVPCGTLEEENDEE